MPSNGFARLAWFLLRVVAGLMFMQAGGMKLLDWFGGMAGAGQPPIEVGSQAWIGGVLELVGGALVMIGLFTRPVAFILAGEMAVAYWQFHYDWANSTSWTWPIQNHGGEAVLFCFIFLLFAAQGAGMLSVDGLRRSRTAQPAR
ncbi:MAG TPA: DoxX family protein [Planctomycetota bacterium]|nr:DoxX family protein [Planctomycetota bacterium]